MFWYNLKNILTYNALINMVFGGRGIGKTFSAKDWACSDFINNENQFVWVRRYESEFKRNKTFFDDIIKEKKYPDHELKVDGMDYIIDGKLAGYAFPLSTSKNEKGDAFPYVSKILFDEVLIETGVHRYLPGEVEHFLNLFETVGRLREPRAILLSNSITETNPYFMYWNIKPRKNTGVVFRKNSDDPARPLIVVEFPECKEYQEFKKSTRFGQLIEGTAYGDYAISNKFLKDNNTFIQKKSEHSNYSFTIKYKGSLYGVWIDYQAGHFYVSNNVDPFCRVIFTLTLDDHSPNTMLIKSLHNAPHFKLFIENYKASNVYFEDIRIKNITYEVIKLLLT